MITLLLTAQLVVQAGAFHGCGVRGDAKAQMASDLDVLKNRADIPSSAAMVSMSFADFATHGKPVHPLAEWKPVRVRMWIGSIKPGGLESANCHAKDLALRDTHIEAYADETMGGRPVIVEVTPRFRGAMATAGVDWSTAALKHALAGHFVEVEGWPFWDGEHENASDLTHPGGAHNWRSTPLEIHPVTALRLVPP